MAGGPVRRPSPAQPRSRLGTPPGHFEILTVLAVHRPKEPCRTTRMQPRPWGGGPSAAQSAEAISAVCVTVNRATRSQDSMSKTPGRAESNVVALGTDLALPAARATDGQQLQEWVRQPRAAEAVRRTGRAQRAPLLLRMERGQDQSGIQTTAPRRRGSDAGRGPASVPQHPFAEASPAQRLHHEQAKGREP